MSKSGSDDSIINTEKRGRYLFFRWLVDTYGEDILASLVQIENVGLCNIEDATEAELKDAVAWQVALLHDGKTNMEGNDLVDTSEWDHRSPSLLSAPIIDPEPGDNYGANGYQSGIDVAGTKQYMDGGTTEEATEIEENAVVLGNTDHFTFVAAIPFNAAVAGATAHTSFCDRHSLRDGDAGGPVELCRLEGCAHWWNDPERVDYKVENIFSATDANNMTLQRLLTTEARRSRPSERYPRQSPHSWCRMRATWQRTSTTRIAGCWTSPKIVTPTRRSPWPSPSTVATTTKVTWHHTTSGRQSFLRAVAAERMGHGEGTVMRAWTSATPHPCWTTCYYQMFLSSDPGTSGVTADFDPCGSI